MPRLYNCFETELLNFTEAIPLCSNKFVKHIIYRQYTTVYQYSDIIYTVRSHYGNMFRPKRPYSSQ